MRVYELDERIAGIYQTPKGYEFTPFERGIPEAYLEIIFTDFFKTLIRNEE